MRLQLTSNKSINQLNSDLFDSKEDPIIKVRKKAMDYLARREYAYKELIQKLERAGNESSYVADVVDQLSSEGFQCDNRYTESFVRTKIAQGKGPKWIRYELKKKGVGQDIIDITITNIEEDWYLLAKDVRSRKFGDKSIKDFKEKSRQIRFLQYRGFESEHIREAMSYYVED